MIKKEVTLYEYTELKEEVKQRVINSYKDTLSMDTDYKIEEELTYKANELLEIEFETTSIYVNNILYNLNYSQGSGAMMEFSISDTAFMQYLRDVKKIITNKEYQLLIDYNIKFDVSHNNTRYYHENAFVINTDLYNSEADNEVMQKLINDICDYIDINISDIIVNINKELKNIGYELLDYYNSNEYIEDYILNCTEELYYSNGDIFNEE